jgi:formylglycine-generating enzyme required for sulfatase activity
VTSVLQKVLRHDVVPLAELRPGLPDAVYALVASCMDPDPTKRPQDAEQMRHALAQVRLVAPGTPVPPSVAAQKLGASQVGLLATAPSKDTVPSQPPTVDLERKKPLNKGALAVIGVVAAGAAYLAVRMLNARHAEEHADAAVIAPETRVPGDAATDAATDAAIDTAIDAPAAPPEMVQVSSGTFDLGDDHPEGLAKQRVSMPALWIDRTEVTLGAVRASLADDRAGGAKGDALGTPARMVTWAQADAVCRSQGKRLPTELEWEAAALTTPQDASAATLKTGKPLLPIAQQKDCSAAGLCDMLGSVLEWTATDGTKPGTKVVRGASFRVSPAAGWQASIHFRIAVPADRGDAEVGFRCVKDPS